jgi:Protein of unknown function (DUF3606)
MTAWSRTFQDPSPERETVRSVWRILMGSLTKREQPDRSKINMHEPHEVKYWTHKLNVSKEELQKAVDTVGNSAAADRASCQRPDVARDSSSGFFDPVLGRAAKAEVGSREKNSPEAMEHRSQPKPPYDV